MPNCFSILHTMTKSESAQVELLARSRGVSNTEILDEITTAALNIVKRRFTPAAVDRDIAQINWLRGMEKELRDVATTHRISLKKLVKELQDEKRASTYGLPSQVRQLRRNVEHLRQHNSKLV